MEDKGICCNDKPTRETTVRDDDLAQVTGGHSHARSPVFKARKPGGGLSSYKCNKCGLVLPDAGAYFEHQKMAHGE